MIKVYNNRRKEGDDANIILIDASLFREAVSRISPVRSLIVKRKYCLLIQNFVIQNHSNYKSL